MRSPDSTPVFSTPSQSGSRDVAKSGSTDPAGLEWRRVFHDSESFRNRRHSHCGH